MLPIVDVKTMQESDRATIASGTSSRELMLRAAKGIFESYTWMGKTLIVCGVGNNAGGPSVSGWLCFFSLPPGKHTQPP